jgi:hypothetical protein
MVAEAVIVVDSMPVDMVGILVGEAIRAEEVFTAIQLVVKSILEMFAPQLGFVFTNNSLHILQVGKISKIFSGVQVLLHTLRVLKINFRQCPPFGYQSRP